MGIEELKDELPRAMNEQEFTFVGDGLIVVEEFIRNFLLTNGYELVTFIMEEITGARRSLRIWINSLQYSVGTYIELTIHDALG